MARISSWNDMTIVSPESQRNWWETNFSDDLINLVLSNREIKLKESIINEDSGLTTRNSKISWIKDNKVCQKVFSEMKTKASDFSWLHLDNIESLQYSEYGNNQEYGWHRDCNNIPYPDGRVRKISFSVFLNSDYEGGEFDLELYGPNQTPRYIELNKKKNVNCIMFHSDMWHRVRPVTSGVKKSIVGWMLGPVIK